MAESGPTVREGADHLSVCAGDVEIARYVVRPDSPATESVKPYLYPLRSLTGAPLAGYRPWDHRWHKGLQMTLSHLSGQNFWGGPTFDPKRGYVQLDNNGRQRHDGFDEIGSGAGEAVVTERLTWIASTGEGLLAERRTLRFHSVDHPAGIWALDFTSRLTNISGRRLDVGSPTTLGRPRAGYTGLFWRGPRAWIGGTVLTPSGESDEERVMGTTGEWLAIAGEHDEIDGGGTVLFFAGRSSGPVPITWFARTGEFAGICPSPAFHALFSIAAGADWEFGHRIVFIDRRCDHQTVTAVADRYRP